MTSRTADPRLVIRSMYWIALALLLASGISCSRQGEAPAGVDVRVASPTDQAERLCAEAEALRLQYEARAAKKAIEKLRTSLELRAQIGDFAEAAKASRLIGKIHEQTGDLESALEDYQEGLELARQANDIALESQLLSSVAAASIMLGEPEQAQHDCDGALRLARQSRSLQAEAEAFVCLGELDYFRGNLNEAILAYSKAWSLWQELGDVEGQAQAQLFLGYAHSDLSEFDRATAYYEESLRLWRSLGDRRGESLTLVAMGYIHLRLGEYQSALNSLKEAMPLIQSMGDLVWQASVNSGLANLYYHMADTETAKVYWARALDQYKEAGLRMAEAEVLLSIGEVHLASKDHGSAISYFEEALATTRELDRRWEAHSLRLLGLAYESMGDIAKAIDYYKRSLAILESGEDQRYMAYALGDLGRALQSTGQHDRALDCLSRALDLSRTTQDRLGESMGLFILASIENEQARAAEAREHIEEALLIAESLRSGVESHQLRSSYLAAVQSYYRLHIDLLMRLHAAQPAAGLDALAFETSERARARSLLESLTEAGVDIRTGVPSDLLMRERQLKRTLEARADRQFRLGTSEEDKSGASALAREIRDLTAEYDQLQAEIRSRSPRYAALTQPQPLDLRAVQQEVLNGDTLILEYSLGENQSFLWAVDDQSHRTYTLPARSEIEQALQDAFQNLTARLPVPNESVQEYRARVKGSDDKYWDAATRLSDLLLGQVADQLGNKRIVVVGDGTMQYLPFSALPVPGRSDNPTPLIVDHEIVNLPSVSALGVLRSETRDRETPPLSVAILADPVFGLDDPRFGGGMVLAKADAPPRSVASNAGEPPTPTQRALRDVDFLGGSEYGIPRLVATRGEADAILAAAPEGQTLSALDFAANRERAMSPDLGRYRIIHFATHGVLNNEHPGLSGILLSMVDKNGNPQNGFLRLHDIYNLELPVELVVLSACNTALGKPVEGEGLVGLVRGFMYAGAKRVVASLWKVDDQATGELMKNFYHEMFENGRTPAAALRHAQLALWHQGEWQSPFYWAAFVLQGEWR